MPKPTDPGARRPLSPPVLHILLALADGDRHGYAIKQEIERRTQGTIRLGPSTLYEAIQRLLDGGLIVEAAQPSAAACNGQEAQRRYYTLTARGLAALSAEVRQLGRLVDHARSIPRVRKGLA